MTCSFFESSLTTYQEVTRVFDMVWAIDAGLWHLRNNTIEYFNINPQNSAADAKRDLVHGIDIHGLELKRMVSEYTWEQQEAFVAEILLINAIAVYDSWVNRFVNDTLLNISNNQRSKIAAELKRGLFDSYELALANEPDSQFKGKFRIKTRKGKSYCDNIRLIFKYFKSCRNCLAHGDRLFSKSAEEKYNAISSLTKQDCGLKELPEIALTKANNPFEIKLRGVVGLYDIIIRMILYLDLKASSKVALESEIIKRWNNMVKSRAHNQNNPNLASTVKIYDKGLDSERYSFLVSRNKKKREITIRNCFISINMYAPLVGYTTEICDFLTLNRLVECL